MLFGDLLGKLIGVGSSAKDFGAHQPRRLVVAVTISRFAMKAGNQHIRTVNAYGAHYVAENILLAPVFEDFRSSRFEKPKSITRVNI